MITYFGDLTDVLNKLYKELEEVLDKGKTETTDTTTLDEKIEDIENRLTDLEDRVTKTETDVEDATDRLDDIEDDVDDLKDCHCDDEDEDCDDDCCCCGGDCDCGEEDCLGSHEDIISFAIKTEKNMVDYLKNISDKMDCIWDYLKNLPTYH